MWLRQRNHQFELKSPSNSTIFNDEFSGIDFYDENTDWSAIRDILLNRANVDLQPVVEFDTIPDIRDWLLSNNLFPFATIKTMRQRCLLSVNLGEGKNKMSVSVNVDIDNVEFVDFTTMTKESTDNTISTSHYSVGEVELISSELNYKSNDVRNEQSLILMKVFQHLQIPTSAVRGKVLEYLVRHSPLHYKALETSGLIGSKLK